MYVLIRLHRLKNDCNNKKCSQDMQQQTQLKTCEAGINLGFIFTLPDIVCPYIEINRVLAQMVRQSSIDTRENVKYQKYKIIFIKYILKIRHQNFLIAYLILLKCWAEDTALVQVPPLCSTHRGQNPEWYIHGALKWVRICNTTIVLVREFKALV